MPLRTRWRGCKSAGEPETRRAGCVTAEAPRTQRGFYFSVVAETPATENHRAAAGTAPSVLAPAQQPAALAEPTDAAVIAERMTQRTAESRLEPRKFLKMLQKFLRRLLQDMSSQDSMSVERTKLGEAALEKFFDRLRQLSGEFEGKASRSGL
jgi:hypothetical protein